LGLLPAPADLQLHRRGLPDAKSGQSTVLPAPAPDPLELVRRLVLDAVPSPLTREAYGRALDEFFTWHAERGHPPFNRAAVHGYRTALEAEGYAPSSINQKLAAVRKLAKEAAAHGWLEAETAGAIAQVEGARQAGTRAGNWLTRKQAQQLLHAPIRTRSKGSATARHSPCWWAVRCAAPKP